MRNRWFSGGITPKQVKELGLEKSVTKIEDVDLIVNDHGVLGVCITLQDREGRTGYSPFLTGGDIRELLINSGKMKYGDYSLQALKGTQVEVYDTGVSGRFVTLSFPKRR